MMTNARDHTLTARPFLPGDTGATASGLLESVLKRIQSIVCALHGHDSILQYERTRMFLRCTSCGHETPGWEVSPGAMRMTRRAEPRAARPASGLGIVRKVA
jgi:hypothetical protein